MIVRKDTNIHEAILYARIQTLEKQYILVTSEEALIQTLEKQLALAVPKKEKTL